MERRHASPTERLSLCGVRRCGRTREVVHGFQQEKDAFIYIKDNGAVHDKLRSRAFGSYAYAEGDYPMIDINGRELVRTWSLLADPVRSGDEKMKLMHNAHLMGW